jgi:hypothetical protein
MKSIVTAALVLIVEAGFVLSIAALPPQAGPAPERAAVAAHQAPATPAAPASRS